MARVSLSQPILALDTAYDPHLRAIRDHRYGLYHAIEEDKKLQLFRRLQLEPQSGKSMRDRMFETIRRKQGGKNPYRAILVSTHGEEGRLLNDKLARKEYDLLSLDHDTKDISDFASGHQIYLFACYACKGDLPNKLLDAEATMVVGFRENPNWLSQSGLDRWKDFDKEIVLCMTNGGDREALEAVRDRFIENVFPLIRNDDLEGDALRDVENVVDTVGTMVIRTR
jgi:hypothetical protein